MVGWGWGGLLKPHCSLTILLRDLPPAFSESTCVCQTKFTHLLLTLELSRASRPLKEEEMLPGSLCEYFKIYKLALIGTLRWIAYTQVKPKRRRWGPSPRMWIITVLRWLPSVAQTRTPHGRCYILAMTETLKRSPSFLNPKIINLGRTLTLSYKVWPLQFYKWGNWGS